MSEKRINRIILVTGTRGTGKTTFLLGSEQLKVDGIIDAYLDRDPKQKILVVDLFDNPLYRAFPIISVENLSRWKQSKYRIFDNDQRYLIANINYYCYNTVIIFEDATKYVNTKLEENLKRLLIDSKQKNNDIVFIFHYLMAIPNDLVRIADYLVLFKTGENFSNYLRNKFPHPDIERVFKEVQESKNFHYNKTIDLT
jgi:hypothetical protein